MPRRRRRSPIRALLITVAVLVVLAVASVSIAAAVFDPNAYKPQISAAVKRATGRDIVLSGPITIARSLTPTVEVSGVALSNMASGSRPEMLTLGRAEAEIALWPLLSRRIVVSRLVLIGPELLLETDAQGHGNWQFTTEPRGLLSSSAPSAPEPPGARRFVVQSVHVRDGRVTWHDGRDGRSRAVIVPRLDATDGTDTTAQARTVIFGEVTLNGQPVAIAAETGSLERMQDPAATTPWPLHLSLSTASAQLSASGTAIRPLEFSGYTLVLDGAVPDLSALSTLSGFRLPPLRDVHLAGNLSDAGGSAEVSSMSLHAGASDLSSIEPGFRLDRVDITAPKLDQPVKAGVQGTLAGAPLQLALTLGAPRALLAPLAGGGFPVDITGQVAGATLSLKGALAKPETLSGLDLAFSAAIPDLAALSSLAGRALPSLRDLAVRVQVQDGDGGLRSGVRLRDLSVAALQSDVAGEATLRFDPRPSVQAVLTSRRIDADTLFAAFRTKPPSASPNPTPSAAVAAQPSETAPRAPRPSLAIPVEALPWERLRERDADMSWTVAELRSGGMSAHDVAMHLLLRDGKLAFETQAGAAALGRTDAAATLDASASPPSASATLHAPALPLKPLLELFGLPNGAGGTADIDADLHGEGGSLHEIAATLDGHLGFATVDADIDNEVLSAALGEVVRASRLPVDFGAGGRTRLRCLVIRLDASHGTATANALLLDSPRLLLQGGGTLAMGDEALALRLRPLLRVGGPGIVLPVRVGGTLRAPSVALDPGGGAEALASLAGRATQQSAERGADACTPALATARGAKPGPLPSPAPPVATKLPNAAELLRSLGR